jgi:hypothetical protein
VLFSGVGVITALAAAATFSWGIASGICTGTILGARRGLDEAALVGLASLRVGWKSHALVAVSAQATTQNGRVSTCTIGSFTASFRLVGLTLREGVDTRLKIALVFGL